ncbi:hypothetical protein TH30_04000 [Thalassospira profundimaris]|mgnify:CR=1 FL=1|uniref:Pentapeptide repeat-containing protein n=1 Tax=Thalassospira profundimaris TaxID=502049 RepID=A0A367X7M8_9PROT|nr:hypothetical protein TH30_04000 [Thalassospira profundimaris]
MRCQRAENRDVWQADLTTADFSHAGLWSSDLSEPGSKGPAETVLDEVDLTEAGIKGAPPNGS